MRHIPESDYERACLISALAGGTDGLPDSVVATANLNRLRGHSPELNYLGQSLVAAGEDGHLRVAAVNWIIQNGSEPGNQILRAIVVARGSLLDGMYYSPPAKLLVWLRSGRPLYKIARKC